jgi:hypothetical protein
VGGLRLIISRPLARVGLSIAVGALTTMLRDGRPSAGARAAGHARRTGAAGHGAARAAAHHAGTAEGADGDARAGCSNSWAVSPRRRRRNPSRRRPRRRAGGRSRPCPSPTESEGSITQKLVDRYQDGIVVWQTEDDAKVPFLLKFNVNTQVRYLNTTSTDESFTDHLGVVRDVNERNDITVNRSMFILGGYIFDPRLRYSSTVWTSAGAASIVVGGTIGWQFNKAFTLTGGYNGVPGQPIAGQHLSVLPVDRPHHGGQLLPSRVHAGNLGHRGPARTACTTWRSSATD